MNEFDSIKMPDASKDDPLADSLNRWANDTQGYQPLDIAGLATVSQPPRRSAVFGLRAAATLAAAAMFLFAFAQVSFAVSLGEATLEWGTTSADDVEALSAQLAEAESRISLFENQLITHVEAINTVAAQNAMLSESLHATAIQLVQRQDLESAARWYDMQNLAQMVIYEP